MLKLFVRLRGMQKPVADWSKTGWCRVTAIFTAEKKMILYFDSRKVTERKLSSLIPREPNIAWRIGGPSDVESGSPWFTGVISSVRLSAGELPPK